MRVRVSLAAPNFNKFVIVYFFMIKILRIISISLLFTLNFCAKPEVVQIVKPNDLKLSCDQLEDEIAETEKVKRDAQYAKKNTGGNAARLVLFWPAWATTLHNADKAISAANDRNFNLIKIMKDKNCVGVNTIEAKIKYTNFNDLAYQLQTIKDLYDAGALTKDEFITAKKKILDK